ncbi:Acetyltransferase, GNAT family protein [Sulfitobacter noctilucicola]|uniref:Ribosomal protein S18 acetylase RimI-like enzyme n=1 Tax=Sulfitobacter noctilucicola TaxID=1342301 RepID=A0A7W6M7S3_9RHOB|nr:GNAT family N-acetyltransferase [Sulfitobacter noctilucicola]KIN64861.1 Acetyltransferase, GNAT family protein [Sulfitobacter noctilucicola]MBB4173996.1 ribosomal protein S18 acetylase RimI-like enzyme [Sulfitobacter noctilucicola]
MSAALTLAKPEHLNSIAALCAAFHAEEGITQTDETRRAALEPLLGGSPYGVVYLIGPARAPIGYIVICFGWSVEFGGLDAIVDELYIRPGVRGRGIATEALIALPRALSEGGLRAIHLEVDRDNAAALKLYRRAGFAPREKYMFMSRVL